MAKRKLPIQEIKQRLDTLASTRRLRILAELKRHKTLTVGELAENLNIGYPNVSQHLRILRLAGIVKPIRRGNFIAYRLLLQQEETAKAILGFL